jgi:hypothetical protein
VVPELRLLEAIRVPVHMLRVSRGGADDDERRHEHNDRHQHPEPAERTMIFHGLPFGEWICRS